MKTVYQKHLPSQQRPQQECAGISVSINQLIDTLGLVWQALVRRKIMIISVITLIIVIPIAYLTLRYGGKTEAAWMDDNFAYRQRVDTCPVVIAKQSTTGAQTDYQVLVKSYEIPN